MKLNHALKTYNITSTGFPAVQGIGIHSNKEGVPVALSTLPASELLEQGITQYLAPRFERGQVFKTTEEIIEANIEVDAFKITEIPSHNSDVEILEHEDNSIIVSRHEGTIKVLKGRFPNTPVFKEEVGYEDIVGKHVIGTIPPRLAVHAMTYTPVTIENFDYTIDGDLTGNELLTRLKIGKPFKLEKVEGERIPDDLESIKEDFKRYDDKYDNLYYTEKVYDQPFDAYLNLGLNDLLSSCGDVLIYNNEEVLDDGFGATAVYCSNYRLHLMLHEFF